jgi:integrase
LLDGIERADSLNGLRCQWRLVQLVQVDEFASRMRPAGGFEDLAAVVELRKARIPVGLQNAAKVCEVFPRMFALAIGAVETPRVPRGTAVALSVDEVKRMLIAGDETRWGPFIRLALGCGARRGELLALRWAEVDIDGRALTIRGSLSQTRAGITEKPTKTDRVRLVALADIAIEALRQQAATQARDRDAAEGNFMDSGHVFQGPLGGCIRPYSATDAFRKLARKVGISTTKLHALRHTTGSWLIASGVDPRTAASVLGHSLPMITLSIYSHLVKGVQTAAVAHIDERLNMAATELATR